MPVHSAILSKAFDLLQKHVLEKSSITFVLDSWLSYDSFPVQDGVYKLEARQGVGEAIRGFVAASVDGVKPISVLANPASLHLLAPALAEISSSHVSVVVHVAANSTNVAELYDALQSLHLNQHGWGGEILFSGGNGAKEILETVNSAYSRTGKSVISIFDDAEAGQELGIYDISSGQGPIEPLKYHGPASPHSIILLPSSMHSALATAALTLMDSPAAEKVGIVTLQTLSGSTFREVASYLPPGVQTVHAPVANTHIDESATWFYESALAGITSSGKTSATILPLPLIPTWTIKEWASTIVRLASPSSSKAHMVPKLPSMLPESSKLASFWSSDVGASSKVAPLIAASFARIAHASEGGVIPRLLETYDNTAGAKSANGLGVKSADLLLSPTSPVESTKLVESPLSAIISTSEPSFIFISAPQFVLPSYNAVERASENTQIVFSSTWAAEEFKDKLGKHEKNKLAKHNGIWTINAEAVAKQTGFSGDEGTAVVEQIAFWQFYLNDGESSRISGLVTSSLGQDDITKLISAVKDGLRRVDLTPSDMEIDEEEKAVPLHLLAPGEGDSSIMSHPSSISTSQASYAPNAFKANPEIMPAAQNWHLAAKQLLYPEAYAMPTVGSEVMRPDLPEENYVITVTENRRLTPDDYDRNVFHIEFSTAGTGLKYSVGEALGIHGLNDEKEVMDFIEWYELDPSSIVSYPSRTDPSGRLESRTVFQLFQQTLDVFGKPPKAFYETLSKFATSKEEARHLRFISSAEGSSTFKKWADLQTVTYVDVLKAFPSAKASFGIEALMREVASIKPRHYSIASSQNAVGDSVHLLVVTVDWDTPEGVKRYGQCTRYLAGLKVGTKVMASVKPSVMKVSIRGR